MSERTRGGRVLGPIDEAACGQQRSWMANTVTSSRPAQKAGMAIPTRLQPGDQRSRRLAVAHASEDAEWQCHDECDHRGCQGQRAADGELLDDDRADLRLGQERDAEVAAQHAAEPLQVAEPARLIEPELLAERLDRLWRGARAEDDRRRVARQDVDDGEDDDRRAQQAEQQGHEPPSQQQAHAVRLVRQSALP